MSKNDRHVVAARRKELASYCGAILQLAARLGSPQTDLAVQRFLRRSGGGVHYRWAELPVPPPGNISLCVSLRIPDCVSLYTSLCLFLSVCLSLALVRTHAFTLMSTGAGTS